MRVNGSFLEIPGLASDGSNSLPLQNESLHFINMDPKGPYPLLIFRGIHMVTAGLLPLFETREDKDRIRDQWTGIAPTMDQVSRKQKRIPAIQMVNLILNLILKLPPEANHELMTRMDHRLGPAICPTLQG